MQNPYYSTESRGPQVERLFDRIADRYDLLNDLQSFGLHRRWKRRAAAEAGLKPGWRLLDLCTGTGDLLEAALLREPRVRAVGLDFTERMLLRAGRKPWSGQVALVRGDALQLPFPDGSFDAVTIGYGLRNLASIERALAEIRRVLRPGGRFVGLEFGKPELAPWRAAYFAWLRFVVPVLGWLVGGDRGAYAYILVSLKHYPGPREFLQTLGAGGFHKARMIPLLGGVMTLHCATKG